MYLEINCVNPFVWEAPTGAKPQTRPCPPPCSSLFCASSGKRFLVCWRNRQPHNSGHGEVQASDPRSGTRRGQHGQPDQVESRGAGVRVPDEDAGQPGKRPLGREGSKGRGRRSRNQARYSTVTPQAQSEDLQILVKVLLALLLWTGFPVAEHRGCVSVGLCCVNGHTSSWRENAGDVTTSPGGASGHQVSVTSLVIPALFSPWSPEGNYSLVGLESSTMGPVAR